MKSTTKENIIWDVVVIGGGPAGMMAAGVAAQRGRSVLLLEKNPTLGKKLLITGGGRCNVTNNKTDLRTMLSQYKGNDQFLFSAFSQFAVSDTLTFFHDNSMPTKVEAEDRVFPASNTAQSVWDVLVDQMKEVGVHVQTNAAVAGISIEDKTGYIIITLKDKTKVAGRSCIVATGGTSRPETGSSGEGFMWLKKLGHTIVNTDVALVPIALNDAWVKKIAGITLQDIKLTPYHNGVKQKAHKGKVLFTHFGMSGPTVLNMSKEIGEMIQYGDVTIMLDLFPNLDHSALKKELQTLLVEGSNKRLKTVLATLMPLALVTALLTLLKINGDTPNHSVRSEDRTAIITMMKSVPLHVSGLLGSEKAVVSSGGVALSEVNFKTMESRVIPHLYLIGDVLNIDRPSGGYSLQLCWTTGYVAGNAC